MADERHKITIAVLGGSKAPFNHDAAMKAARGFHAAACELEAVHQRELATVPKGRTIDGAVLDAFVGKAAGAIVLEALAIEITLKAKLNRAGVQSPPKTHDHSQLFAQLPDVERSKAERHYATNRHPAMRLSLGEVLASSATLFEQWRYLHEAPSVTGSMGELQRAFAALCES